MKKMIPILVLACASWAHAQDAAPATPADPSQTSSSQETANDEETAAPTTVWKADGRPASSVVARGVGTPTSGPSLRSMYQDLTTSLAFTQNVGSRSGNLQNQDNGNSTSFTGAINARKRFGRANMFRINYTGGYSYFYDTTNPDRVFHSVLLSQDFVIGKMTMSFHDQMRFSPEAGFGFEPISGDESLDPGVTNNDSILTNFGQRISNTAAAELGYRLSPHNTINTSATYTLSRFLDNLGGFESDQTNVRASFEHRFNPRQSIYASYGYGFIDYIGNVPGLDFHDIQLGFSRQLPGRFTVQASAGPSIRHQGLFGGLTDDSLNWSASSSLAYRSRKGQSFGLNFSRSTSNGGGITTGSTQSRVETSTSLKFRRKYTNTFRFGYSHNDGISNAFQTDSLYGGYDLSRSLGRNASVRIGYFAQQQSSTGGCTNSLCQYDGLRQGVVIGLRYSFHPFDVRR